MITTGYEDEKTEDIIHDLLDSEGLIDMSDAIIELQKREAFTREIEEEFKAKCRNSKFTPKPQYMLKRFI